MTEPDPSELRVELQALFRNFGILKESTTPCGLPIKPSQAHGLMLLLESSLCGVSLSQQALVERLGIDKSNVARLCSKMVKEDLIVQTKSPSDARQFDITLTPKGLRMAKNIEEKSKNRFLNLLQAIPESARPEVMDALRVLNSAISKI